MMQNKIIKLSIHPDYDFLHFNSMHSRQQSNKTKRSLITIKQLKYDKILVKMKILFHFPLTALVPLITECDK